MQTAARWKWLTERLNPAQEDPTHWADPAGLSQGSHLGLLTGLGISVTPP